MLRQLLALGVWLLVCLGPAQAQAFDCDQLAPIDQAWREVRLDGRTVHGERVDLPDNIPRPWRTERYRLHYRFSLPDCPPRAEPLALLIHRVGAPYRIRVDGQPMHPIDQSAWTTERPFNGRIGGVFAVPAGARQVEVSLETLPNVGGGLIGVVAGPQSRVLSGPAVPHSLWADFFRFAGMAIGMAGLLSLLIWSVRRRETQLLWFGLLCMHWMARNRLLLSFNVPWDPYVFEQINPLMLWSAALLVAVSTLLSLRSITVLQVRLLWLQAVVMLLGFGASLLVPSLAGPYRMMSFGLGFLTLLWLVSALIRQWRHLSKAHAAWLAAGFLAVMLGAIHDLLMILGVLRPGWWSLLTPGFTVLLFCHLISVGLYLLNNLKLAENSNAELESSIAAKSRELERSYALLRESERASARAQERARFNREIHDGLGAQLITALRGVERDALSKDQVLQTLQEGLDELRLLMDSSDLGRSLLGALVAWRNRWDARLQAIGLQLHWSVTDDLDALELGSDATLQIMRVLQESVTNTLKHAGARNLSIWAWREAGPVDTLRLEIQDDGRGLPEPPTEASGRGLRHMAQRAEKLGARLVVSNAPAPQCGVRVSLSLPLPEGDFPSSDAAPLMA